MFGQYNDRAITRDNAGQNRDERHTPSPTIGIKISEHAGNRTLAAGLEGRDSTDHATATDEYINIYLCVCVCVKKCRITLRDGSTNQNKKKKSNKHGSGNARFLRSVHLFIVAKNKCSIL